MTERQLEKRYKTLEDMTGDKRHNYSIKLDGSFITIRNKETAEGINTDSLQTAKQWIRKDMK